MLCHVQREKLKGAVCLRTFFSDAPGTMCDNNTIVKHYQVGDARFVLVFDTFRSWNNSKCGELAISFTRFVRVLTSLQYIKENLCSLTRDFDDVSLELSVKNKPTVGASVLL